MNNIVLSSTFLLTLLLIVGLVFFLRGSFRDRTQQITLTSQLPVETVLQRFETYFEQRAYQVKAFDPQNNQITWEGLVRPSWFLAIFVTIMAASGFLCLGLVLSLLFPGWGNWTLLLSFLSPLAGWIYWQKSSRSEQVMVKLKSEISPILVTITAHRDELLSLQKSVQV